MRTQALALWLVFAANLVNASEVSTDAKAKQYDPATEQVIDESCNLQPYGPDAPTSRSCELSTAAISPTEVLIKTDQGTFVEHADNVDINKVSLEKVGD